MVDQWYDADTWDDTDDPPDGTHECFVCEHLTTIHTPQRRAVNYCPECEAWRRFESVFDDPP